DFSIWRPSPITFSCVPLDVLGKAFDVGSVSHVPTIEHHDEAFSHGRPNLGEERSKSWGG
ncbi:hypothetical protein, partial [Metallosphaera yellowstonensis]